MTMTVAEYNERRARVNRMMARVAELDAAIDARENAQPADQIQAFAFNQPGQPADVSSVAGPESPEFAPPTAEQKMIGEGSANAIQNWSSEGTSAPSADASRVASEPTFREGGTLFEQALGTKDFETVKWLQQDKPEQLPDTPEGLIALAKQTLAKGQLGEAPAEATRVGITGIEQIEPPAMRLNVPPEPGLGTSIKESIDAAAPAMAQSLSMGLIQLSERDKKAMAKSPIAATIGSLLGDVPGVIGAVGAGKLTLAGMRRIAPKLIESWLGGGEEVGRIIVNAAAREGLGGAYWSTLKQAIEETVANPDEKRDWNDRLTQLATDVGMFAIGGAVVEGVMAGRSTKITGEDARATTDSPSVREAPTTDQLAKLQERFKPLDQVVDERAGKIDINITAAKTGHDKASDALKNIGSESMQRLQENFDQFKPPEVNIVDEHPQLGRWQDKHEPSIRLEVTGDKDQVRRYAAKLAKEADDQEAVLLVDHSGDTHDLYKFNLPDQVGDTYIKELGDRLTASGIPASSIDLSQGDLVIVDLFNDLSEKVAQLANDLNIRPKKSRVSAELVERKDYDRYVSELEQQTAKQEVVGRSGSEGSGSQAEGDYRNPLPEKSSSPRLNLKQAQELANEPERLIRRSKPQAQTKEEPFIEIASEWQPQQFDYAAHTDASGKTVFGQVGSEVNDKGMVTFKPRKGKAYEVPADQLREPTSVPRTRDDIEQVLEAAENQRRITEEGVPEAKGDTGGSPVLREADDASVIGGEEVGTKPVKPLGQKVKDAATKFEDEAKARIKRRMDEGAQGKLFDVVGASVEAAENLKDLGIIGAAKIARGTVEFAEWSAEMIKDFGEAVKPHLETIYNRARDEFHKTRAKATVEQHLEYMKDISQPFDRRPRVVATEPTASGGRPGFRTGYGRLREIKQGLREQRTGQKLRGKALEESMIDDELRTFTEDAWKAGAPVMKTKQGTLIQVFDSKADAERIWDYVYARAKAKFDRVPKTTASDEQAITMEARKLFLQEMVDRGVALKRKRTPVQLSPDVKRKTDLSLYIILKADMGAEKLKAALAGIPADDLVARQAKLTELGMERGLLSPAVRAQGTFVPLDFAGYGGFKDVAGETLDPTRLIQAIDGALSVAQKVETPGQAGPLERYLLWRTRDMLKQKMAWQADMEAVGKKALAGLKKPERELVSDVLEQLASREADNLTIDGMLKDSAFRDITTDPKVLQAALDLRPIYDDVLEMQNALRVQRSQKTIPKRAFYSPHKQKEVSAFQELLGLNADPANLLSTGTMVPDFVIPNKPRIGHDLQRILLEPKWELEKDALVLLQKYLNAAGKDIFDTSIIQNAKAFMDQLEVMGYGKSAVALRDWVGQSFAGAPHRFDKMITEALSSSMGDVIGKNWQKWSGQFRGALARSVFPLNISWNLFLQTSSGALTTTRYGAKASSKGLLRWVMDSKFREDIAENAYSAIVKSQKSGRISHQDFNQGMSRAIALEKKPLETATDAANFLSEWIERHMTGWSISAGYEDGLAKGLSGKALWEYASDAGAKTQSMYNKEDLPGLLRSSGVKTIAPFQTFAFEMWNTIQEVAGRVGTPPSTKQERIKTILRFVAGATAVNMISAEYSGRKPWEIGSYIPFYPIFGKPIEAALKGESLENSTTRGLPSPVGIGVAFGKAVEDAIKDGNFEKLKQFGIRYGTAAVGIPGGTELARLYDAIESIAKGGKFDKNDKLQFPITDTKEQIRALVGGSYSTEAGMKKLEDESKGVLELAEPSSTAGKIGAKVTEALPVAGDFIEFAAPKDEQVDLTATPRRNSRRRARRR